MKRILALVLSALLVFGLASCTTTKDPSSEAPTSKPATDDSKPTEEPTGASGKITVAALESAYGADLWNEVAEEFAKVSDVEVEVLMDKELENVVRPQLLAGSGPDLVHLALGRPDALTETMVKDKALADISDVFEMTIPGESATPASKMIDGFLDAQSIMPYGDGKTYLAPMFYSPTGLFYNTKLFEEKGWELPKTWDEMWALGDKAKEDGIALFSYPTTGYFDTFTYALISSAGGLDFFNKVTNYEAGIWDTPEAQKVFDTIDKLATYTDKTVPANANNQNFMKNQELVVNNKAIFMPNGTWIEGEMADAVAALDHDFEWGLLAMPAFESGGDRYATTFFEQCWIPSNSQNVDGAKEFMAFLYSDKAGEIFAKHGAVQPIKGLADNLEGAAKNFYAIYDDGTKAVMGSFSSAVSVEGVSMADSLFETINSLVSGDKTKAEWEAGVKEANKALNEAE